MKRALLENYEFLKREQQLCQFRSVNSPSQKRKTYSFVHSQPTSRKNRCIETLRLGIKPVAWINMSSKFEVGQIYRVSIFAPYGQCKRKMDQKIRPFLHWNSNANNRLPIDPSMEKKNSFLRKIAFQNWDIWTLEVRLAFMFHTNYETGHKIDGFNL